RVRNGFLWVAVLFQSPRPYSCIFQAVPHGEQANTYLGRTLKDKTRTLAFWMNGIRGSKISGLLKGLLGSGKWANHSLATAFERAQDNRNTHQSVWCLAADTIRLEARYILLALSPWRNGKKCVLRTFKDKKSLSMAFEDEQLKLVLLESKSCRTSKTLLYWCAGAAMFTKYVSSRIHTEIRKKKVRVRKNLPIKHEQSAMERDCNLKLEPV
ncbi:hypothetical protein AKJ16_DCAP18555, partial [Drosera capensis]